jgi:pilus assembly protein CpaE
LSMMPLTAAIVVASRTVWDQAHACVQNLPVRLAIESGLDQNEPADADALLDRIERHQVDVVLVETGRIAMPFEEFVRRLKNTTSQPAVFVLNPEASPELILEALRAGANEYLYPPMAETLRDALQKLSAQRSKGASDTANALGKLFGFLSARGGCGASTIAAHVATDLAHQVGTGPRSEATLLADFDFEAGLIRFLMKSKTSYSVQDAISNLRRMDSSLWKALVSANADRLDMIPSPDEVAAKKPPEREETLHLLRFIRSTYPAAIIDFGRSVSVSALDGLPEMDLLYVVTTPELSAVACAARAVRDAEDRGFAANRIKVVLNRAVVSAKVSYSAAEKVLGRAFDVTLRDDHMQLYDAYSEGRFLSPTSALGKELHQLAVTIRQHAFGEIKNDKTPAQAGSGGKRWFGLFGKQPAGGKATPEGAHA